MKHVILDAVDRLDYLTQPNNPQLPKQYEENTVGVYLSFFLDDRFTVMDAVFTPLAHASLAPTESATEVLGVRKMDIGSVRNIELFHENGQPRLRFPLGEPLVCSGYVDGGYHDYDNGAQYTWTGPACDTTSGPVIAYELDYLLYRLLSAPKLYERFVPTLIPEIFEDYGLTLDEMRRYAQKLNGAYQRLCAPKRVLN